MAIRYPIIFSFDKKGLTQAESALGKFGKAVGGIAAGATAAVAGIAAVGVKAFADFDAKLNQSTAIMGEVSDAMRNDMAEAAREVAKTTTFSADQAAESYFFLASAGLDAASSIKAMPEVAKFAQAGMFDMALATDLLTDAQSALGLTIRDDAVKNMENMVRVSDVLVKANTLANASVEQFSTALTTKAGAALRALGKDVEEGVAVLAAFADQGIKGELAGTQLSIVLRDLSTKAIKNKEDFEALGLQVFDSNGEMRNLGDIIANLEDVLGGMSDETQKATLLQAGFSDKSLASLTALLGTSDAIKTYEAELRKAGGTTDEVANKQLETFSAQLELAKSRIHDVSIGVGAALIPIFIDLLDQLTPIIDSLMPVLIQMFEDLAPVIAGVVALLPELLAMFVPLFPVLGQIAEQVFELAVALFPLLTQVMQGLIMPLVNLLPLFFEILNSIFMPLIPIVMQLIDAFIPLLQAILPVLIDLINTLLPIMTIFLNDIIIPLMPAVVALITAFLPLIEKVLPVLLQIMKEAVIPVLQFFSRLLTGVVVGAINFVVQNFENWLSYMVVFADDFKKIWDGISGFTKGIINGIIGFIQTMVNGVVDGVNQVIRALNTIKVTIPAWVPGFGGMSFGINLREVGKIRLPKLAEGGIVMPQPGGVIAQLAEAGKPEAVIPLDRIGGFGATNYNITVNAGLGTDGKRVGQQIVEEIVRYEKVSGKVFARA